VRSAVPRLSDDSQFEPEERVPDEGPPALEEIFRLD
jgi:hypothetical protein